MKKIVCLILLFATLLTPVMFACANNGGNPDSTSAEGSSSAGGETSDIVENVPDVDYDGRKFRVLVRPDAYYNEIESEESADIVDSAVYNRNRELEERFGFEFDIIKSSNSNYETDALDVIMSHEDAYDLVLPHARVGMMYASENILLNWRTDLPYVDLAKPWWSENIAEEFTLGNKLYCMNGSISYLSLGYSFGLFFNKDLFEDQNIEFPYETAKEGNWTFDRMSQIARAFSRDLDGNEKIDPNFDQFGYTTADWHGCMNVLWAQGGHIAAKNSDGELVLDLYNDHNESIFDRYFELVEDKSSYVQNSEAPETNLIKMFGDGRSAFLEYSVFVIEELRAYETEFGILPSPKYDETQEEYLTVLNAGASLMCVPITTPDTEFVSVVLEAWAAESRRRVIPAYYDVALKTKHARDDQSAKMLDIIISATTVDFAYFNQSIEPVASAGYVIAHDPSHNFSSFYNQYRSSAEQKIEEINDAYGT